MIAAGPGVTAMVLLTTGIAVVLTVIGIHEGLLRVRPDPRRCPSCVRRLWAWTCWHCTDSRDT